MEGHRAFRQEQDSIQEPAWSGSMVLSHSRVSLVSHTNILTSITRFMRGLWSDPGRSIEWPLNDPLLSGNDKLGKFFKVLK